jgi:CheY-like chemotaxis protein
VPNTGGQSQSKLQQPEQSKPIENIDITMVDDSPAATTLFQELCSNLAPSANIHIFSSAEEALPFLAQNPTDLVIVDLTLEAMNGHQLLSRIRNISHHRGTPVVVMSSSQNPADRATALAGGAVMFVSKSVNLEETEQQCRELIEVAAAHRRGHRN